MLAKWVLGACRPVTVTGWMVGWRVVVEMKEVYCGGARKWKWNWKLWELSLCFKHG